MNLSSSQLPAVDFFQGISSPLTTPLVSIQSYYIPIPTPDTLLKKLLTFLSCSQSQTILQIADLDLRATLATLTFAVHFLPSTQYSWLWKVPGKNHIGSGSIATWTLNTILKFKRRCMALKSLLRQFYLRDQYKCAPSNKNSRSGATNSLLKPEKIRLW